MPRRPGQRDRRSGAAASRTPASARIWPRAAIEIVAPLARKLAAALRAVRRVPDDLHGAYEAAYELVTADPQAMPKDGDFITGEKTAAEMAARMLAARISTQPGCPARTA